jgi:hypothetical protein
MKSILLVFICFWATYSSADPVNVELRLNKGGGLEEVVNGIRYDYPHRAILKVLANTNRSNPVIVNVSSDIHFILLLDYCHLLSAMGFTDISVTTSAKVPQNSQTPTTKLFAFRFTEMN